MNFVKIMQSGYKITAKNAGMKYIKHFDNGYHLLKDISNNREELWATNSKPYGIKYKNNYLYFVHTLYVKR